MNSRVYIFGNIENGYTQYPADYTSEIFLNFYKQTTQKSQIIIHREGRLMYYGYIRRLNPDSQYIGFCVVVNGIMFSNIAKLFLVFENAVSDMVSRGNILLPDDNGDLVAKTDNLWQHEKEIKRTAAIIGIDISELEKSAKKLPPISLNSTKDECISFSVSDKNDDIVEASAKCGYTCVFKKTDSDATNTDTDKAVFKKPKEQRTKAVRPGGENNPKKRTWTFLLILLSGLIAVLCMTIIKIGKPSSGEEAASLAENTVSQETASLQEAAVTVAKAPTSSARNTKEVESMSTETEREIEKSKENTDNVVHEKEPVPQPTPPVTKPIEQKPSEPAPIDINKIYYSYDVDAEFPGGKKARKNWLNDNISWPTDNSGNILHGEVELEFVVERDGRISNIKVTDSENPRLNSEAIRLIGSMPKWTPALLNNQPVRSAVSLTLFF